MTSLVGSGVFTWTDAGPGGWIWRDDASGVTAYFTTMGGGVSDGPWSSLNLSHCVGDDETSVSANRERVCEAIGVDRGRIVSCRQVHGAGVHVVGAITDAIGSTWGDPVPVAQADAIFLASGSGMAAAVTIADCMPVVLAGTQGCAIIHAGWRGILAGVIEAAAGWVGTAATAVIGPTIGACCFEVGPEVAARFDASAVRARPGGRPHVDAVAEVLLRLQVLGIDGVDVLGVCTCCDDRMFSHRRVTRGGGAGVTGRQALIAYRDPPPPRVAP